MRLLHSASAQYHSPCVIYCSSRTTVPVHSIFSIILSNSPKAEIKFSALGLFLLLLRWRQLTRAQLAYKGYLTHKVICNPFWLCYWHIHPCSAPRAIAICLVLILPGSVLTVGTGHVHVALFPLCLARLCVYPRRMNQAPFCLREAAKLYLLTHFSQSPHSPT